MKKKVLDILAEAEKKIENNIRAAKNRLQNAIEDPEIWGPAEPLKQALTMHNNQRKEIQKAIKWVRELPKDAKHGQ